MKIWLYSKKKRRRNGPVTTLEDHRHRFRCRFKREVFTYSR